MSIPNGLAPHVIYSMDGRTWIENTYAAGEGLTRALARGYAVRIPQDKLAALVAECQAEHAKAGA